MFLYAYISKIYFVFLQWVVYSQTAKENPMLLFCPLKGRLQSYNDFIDLVLHID